MLTLKKLLRDLWLTRGRAIVMVASIAVGLLAFNTLVGAYSVLTREIVRNYMDSKPASIVLEMDEVSERTLAYVSAREDVEAAVRRAQVRGRFSTQDDAEKRRAYLFVVDDFRAMDIVKVFPQSGAFPPEPGTVVMERSAQSVVGGGLGTTLLVDLPSRPTQPIRVSGIVHEPALAPANTEQAVYAYITSQDLAALGVQVAFDELRLIPRGPTTDIHSLEDKARELKRDIEAAKLGRVNAIRVPPPGAHPHQSQMTTVLTLFVIFAGLIVLLSSLLTGSLISTMMARQVREMGILKTLGAQSSQILLNYGLLVETIAVLSWAISFYPAELGSEAFVGCITRLLNFDVSNPTQPLGARLVQAGVALCVPLLVALPSLIRGSGVPVMNALSNYGVSAEEFRRTRLERWIAGLESRGQLFAYALRGVLRRRGRFVLSLALFATAGAIFLAAVNTARSWEVVTDRLYESRHYDFEVGFSQPLHDGNLASDIEDLGEVERVEAWLSTRTAPAAGHGLPIERTYPDGAHGAFALVAPPPGSTMVTFDLQAGRLLHDDEVGEVVLNQVVPGSERYAVGDDISLSIDGEDHVLRVVGKVEEVGTGAVAYVNRKTFLALVEQDHRTTLLRVAKAKGSDIDQAIAATNGVLREARAPVTYVSPLTVFENAVAAHFEILVRSLLALAGLTAVVGTMGLASALSANVAESTRDLAVLRAVGATGGQIRSLVTREAIFVCAASFVLATAVGVGLSALIGNLIGMMSFRLPLPLAPQAGAFLALGIVLVGLGMLASLVPARRASGLTVSQALRVL